MKRRSLIIILLALSVGFISVNAKASMTIATFADPSRNSSNPLFTVDFTGMTFTGGWADTQTGLTLQIPYTGATFADVWFEMSDVTIISTTIIPGGGKFGLTGSGAINFYADGAANPIAPLLTISFGSGLVSRYGFGESDETPDGYFITTNVTITGSAIPGTLSEEEFSFSFANLKCLPGSNKLNDGFTTTAAFTSSAVPEPATIALLGFGVLSIVSRKKRA